MSSESKAYLGDGVYAEFDGFGIWLRANAPDSQKAVYLEPEVLDALNRFAEAVQRKGKEDRHAEDQVQEPPIHRRCDDQDSEG